MSGIGTDAYAIEEVARDSHLHCVVTGRYTLAKTLRLIDTVVDAARCRSLERVLVDLTGVHGVATATEKYKLGEKLASVLAEKLAVVGRPPVSDGFAVLVASNRGARARFFTSERDALEWLLKDS